jgi:hypothetical protein
MEHAKQMEPVLAILVGQEVLAILVSHGTKLKFLTFSFVWQWSDRLW